MKLNKYIKTSLAKQFSVLTITIILAFTILLSLLIVYQNLLSENYEEKAAELEEKDRIASDLAYAFNLAISEMRAYFAYDGDSSYFTKVTEQQEIVQDKMVELQTNLENSNDTIFFQQTRDFYEYYFQDVMPKSKEYFDAGNGEAVTELAINQNASETIRTYQTAVKNYTDSLENQIADNLKLFNDRVFFSQGIFLFLLLMIIGATGIYTRLSLKRIGEPLKVLTEAAGEIAEGKQVQFTDRTNRQDELGLLSKAFEKMSKSIQEKELDLQEQNKELISHQTELQSQQVELEEALATTQLREMELHRRYELAEGLSNSLDKQQVLTSVVKSMSTIMDADQGMIVLLNRDKKTDYASIGVSKQGLEQLLEHIDHDHGPIGKIKETKQPFVIKRESEDAEKGYHTRQLFSYDVYLPVLTISGTVKAVMLFTRFDRAFTKEEVLEYEHLCKQIAISLDNIRLYEETEEERKLTQAILASVNEGIQLVDETGTIIQINRKFCEMIDCHTTPIRKPYDIWVEELLSSVDEAKKLKQFIHSALFETGRSETSFVYHQHSPAHLVIQVYCKPLTKGGQKSGTVLVHRDITKEYEVDQMKSDFVSTVSHELRTPLSSVLGFTEMMLTKELKPDRQKKYLTTIYQEANRLTLLINDFLDVQRMEAGKQTYDKKYDDITPLLYSIAENYAENNPNHTINVDVKTKNTMVLGDNDKIGQVLTNLVSNAIKYSPNGGKVDITVYEEGAYIKIAIKDQGLGIPEESLEKLFSKFYRVDNSDRRKIGGTGLGLAIVKEIMKAHQGDVSVQSTLGVGSTFTISFPLVIGLEKAEGPQNHEGKNGVNVIIVEDDINLATLLKTELEDSDFQVKICKDGESALSAIKTDEPDAIVLDIMLGEGRTGWEIIRELKQSEQLKSIPIFISSALEEKDKALALGVDDYLIKPYQPSKLSKLILQTLVKKDWSGQILVPSEDRE